MTLWTKCSDRMPLDDEVIKILDEAERIKLSPPCQECGSMTIQEAEIKCICNGDKDHCHGCDLWTD